MITWKTIQDYLKDGNPISPRLVKKTLHEWKEILSPEVYRITRLKETEIPETTCGITEAGLYTCACCDNLLFDTTKKYDSLSGWPSFTQPILPNVIRYKADTSHEMNRVEALCNVCDAHLGHVFPDGPAPSNLRYCINRLALSLRKNVSDYIKMAVFGGGCFWCTEAIFLEVRGVIGVRSGYSGGSIENPTYEQVCNGDTEHAEVVKIYYDVQQIDFKTLVEIHLTTHDPTTLNRQGNDIGRQYRSIIFYENQDQQKEAQEALVEVSNMYEGRIMTELVPLKEFYPAEKEHQDYYKKHKDAAYCHIVIEPKLEKFRKSLWNKPVLKD